MNYYQNKTIFFKHKNANGKIIEGFSRSSIINNIYINIRGETLDGKSYRILHSIKIGTEIFQRKYIMTKADVEKILTLNPKYLLKDLSKSNNIVNHKIINHKTPNKKTSIIISKKTKPNELYKKYSFDQLLIKAKKMGIKVTKKEGGYYNKKELSRKIVKKIK